MINTEVARERSGHLGPQGARGREGNLLPERLSVPPPEAAPAVRERCEIRGGVSRHASLCTVFQPRSPSRWLNVYQRPRRLHPATRAHTLFPPKPDCNAFLLCFARCRRRRVGGVRCSTDNERLACASPPYLLLAAGSPYSQPAVAWLPPPTTAHLPTTYPPAHLCGLVNGHGCYRRGAPPPSRMQQLCCVDVVRA